MKEGFLKRYELVLIPIGKQLIGDSKAEMQERFHFVPVQIRRNPEGTPKEPRRNSEALKEHGRNPEETSKKPRTKVLKEFAFHPEATPKKPRRNPEGTPNEASKEQGRNPEETSKELRF